MLKLKPKLRYFGHLNQKAHSSEKTLILGKIEGKRRTGQQRMKWLDEMATNTHNENLLCSIGNSLPILCSRGDLNGKETPKRWDI